MDRVRYLQQHAVQQVAVAQVDIVVHVNGAVSGSLSQSAERQIDTPSPFRRRTLRAPLILQNAQLARPGELYTLVCA